MARYKPNYAEVGRWLRSDRNLRGACHSEAGTIMMKAKAIAPVRTGAYRASIHLRDGRGWDGRVAIDVVAPMEYSTVVEKRRHVLLIAAQGS